jgi:flagellar hook-associated protein 1 FlgK
MSDLIGALSLATRGLDAQRFGLDVVGQNIANVNTPGYTRRVTDLASVPAVDSRSAGGGVRVVGVSSTRDQLLVWRVRQEQPLEQREAAVADGLSVVEVALGKTGASVDAGLSAFFDAFSRLGENPTSATARQEVVLQGQSLASTFQQVAGRLATAQRDADAHVRSTVDQVNELATRIGQLNQAIASTAATGGDLTLRDQIDNAVEDLSKLVDLNVIDRADGGSDVSVANGRSLVVGANVYGLSMRQTGLSGMLSVYSQDADVTNEISGGQLAGVLQLRDTLVPGYQVQLDDLAAAVVTQVNALHTLGHDLDGTDAGNFFTPLGGASGAAAAMSVDAAITANPRKVAAAGAAIAGDNGTARAIANLRDARVLDNGLSTFGDAWAQLVYRVGLDTSTARQEQKNRGDILTQVQALRENVSGVSLDEEAMMMMKYQRAYEANARYFQSVNSALDTLMQMLSSA